MRKTLNRSVSDLLRDAFCDKVFKTVIRDNVAIAEAPVQGLNIFEYNKASNGATDYLALAKEIIKLK
jgi:chromosome partitioning protein